MQKPKCRCYINSKYYSRVFSSGKGTLKGYKPCPIHDTEERPPFSLVFPKPVGNTLVEEAKRLGATEIKEGGE